MSDEQKLPGPVEAGLKTCPFCPSRFQESQSDNRLFGVVHDPKCFLYRGMNPQWILPDEREAWNTRADLHQPSLPPAGMITIDEAVAMVNKVWDHTPSSDWYKAKDEVFAAWEFHNRTIAALESLRTGAPDAQPSRLTDEQTSSDAWREWFDRMGLKADVDVVNATANLVIKEREIHARLTDAEKAECDVIEARLKDENYQDLLDQMDEAWGVADLVGRSEINAFIESRMVHKPTASLRADNARLVAERDWLKGEKEKLTEIAASSAREAGIREALEIVETAWATIAVGKVSIEYERFHVAEKLRALLTPPPQEPPQ